MPGIRRKGIARVSAPPLSVATARRDGNSRESRELGQTSQESEGLELVFSGRDGDFAHCAAALSQSADSPFLVAVSAASPSKNRRGCSGIGGTNERNGARKRFTAGRF